MIYFLIFFLFLILTYVLVNVVVFYLQKKFIFHAESLPISHEFQFEIPFEEINLVSLDGETLNGVHFQHPKAKGLLLYFHNHSGNIQLWGQSMSLFYNAGFDVVLMDYRGYGKSGGNFTERLMLSDAQTWYNYALESFDENKIVLYGRGIGSCFATKCAAENHPGLLILESAVYSLAYAAKRHYPYLPIKILLQYQLNTSLYYPNVNCKVVLFHGKEDKVIHFSSSQKLTELNPSCSELVLIDGGNNSNLMRDPEYHEKVLEVLRAL